MVTVADPTTSYGTNAGDPDRAALIGGVGQHLAPDQVHTFVREQLAGARSGRQASVPGGPRRNANLPAAAADGCGVRGAA